MSAPRICCRACLLADEVETLTAMHRADERRDPKITLELAEKLEQLRAEITREPRPAPDRAPAGPLRGEDLRLYRVHAAYATTVLVLGRTPRDAKRATHFQNGWKPLEVEEIDSPADFQGSEHQDDVECLDDVVSRARLEESYELASALEDCLDATDVIEVLAKTRARAAEPTLPLFKPEGDPT